MEITYHVPEVHCHACTASIRRSLDKLDGIEEVRVDLDTRHVTVRFNEDRATALEVKAQIERAGFDVA